MLVTRVKFVDFACNLWRWHEQKQPPPSKLPWMDGQPPDKQTTKTYTWRHTAKYGHCFLRVCWRTSQAVGDHALFQIWDMYCDHLTTLSMWCTASLLDRLAVISAYNIISSYFLAAASSKHLHLLTSLYSMIHDLIWLVIVPPLH